MRQKTVLIVVAHADDMEFMAAGAVARFVDERGYDVYEYILTDNSKGSYRLPQAELIQVSAAEAVEAGRILGLKEVRLDSYADGELNQENPNVLRAKIMNMIREVKADIVMSWDPFAPYEDHPDHRVVAMATLDAAAFSGNPCFHPDPRWNPHAVSEAYWFAKAPMNAGLFVDISTTIDKKIEALLAHDCQMLLTVDFLIQEAETLGVEVPALKDLGASGHKPLIDMAIRNHCAGLGAPHGMAFAEQFRYEKLGMLEKLLGMELITPDFQ